MSPAGSSVFWPAMLAWLNNASARNIESLIQIARQVADVKSETEVTLSERQLEVFLARTSIDFDLLPERAPAWLGISTKEDAVRLIHVARQALVSKTIPA